MVEKNQGTTKEGKGHVEGMERLCIRNKKPLGPGKFKSGKKPSMEKREVKAEVKSSKTKID